MSDFVLDASLALQWFLEDEENRKYRLAVLVSLSEKRALVPFLWFYEVDNGLLMACRPPRRLGEATLGVVRAAGSDVMPHSWQLFSIFDGRLITGQNPASSTSTAQALLKLLGERAAHASA